MNKNVMLLLITGIVILFVNILYIPIAFIKPIINDILITNTEYMIFNVYMLFPFLLLILILIIRKNDLSGMLTTELFILFILNLINYTVNIGIQFIFEKEINGLQIGLYLVFILLVLLDTIIAWILMLIIMTIVSTIEYIIKRKNIKLKSGQQAGGANS